MNIEELLITIILLNLKHQKKLQQSQIQLLHVQL